MAPAPSPWRRTCMCTCTWPQAPTCSTCAWRCPAHRTRRRTTCTPRWRRVRTTPRPWSPRAAATTCSATACTCWARARRRSTLRCCWPMASAWTTRCTHRSRPRAATAPWRPWPWHRARPTPWPMRTHASPPAPTRPACASASPAFPWPGSRAWCCARTWKSCTTRCRPRTAPPGGRCPKKRCSTRASAAWTKPAHAPSSSRAWRAPCSSAAWRRQAAAACWPSGWKAAGWRARWRAACPPRPQGRKAQAATKT